MAPVLPTVERIPSLVSAFSEEKYRISITAHEAVGIDDILVEQLKNLGTQSSQVVANNAQKMPRRE